LLLLLLLPCTMRPSGAGAGAGSSADNAECSFVKDGPSKAQQQLYQCTTCSDGKGRAVCKSCAEVCHAGHRLSPPRSELGVCSCGSLGGCAALSKSRRLTTPGPPPSSTVPLGRGGSTPTSGECQAGPICMRFGHQYASMCSVCSASILRAQGIGFHPSLCLPSRRPRPPPCAWRQWHWLARLSWCFPSITHLDTACVSFVCG
jgi:hypothetical protein